MMLFSVLDQHFRTANYRKLASSDHLHKTLIYLFLFSLLIFLVKHILSLNFSNVKCPVSYEIIIMPQR